MEEIWKDIEGYEGLYQVSNLGRVRSLDRMTAPRKDNGASYPILGTILRTNQRKDGYMSVTFWKDSKAHSQLIHKLVANAFIPNPDNLPVVNHKDEDKTNNRVDNLEWCSQQYNLNYKDINYRSKEKRRKKVVQMTLDGKVVATFNGAREASRITGFSQGNISSVCRGEKPQMYGFLWKYEE